MKSILVPVGSSSNTKSHLQYAVDFAKVFGAKVYAVQIYNVYTKAGTLIKVDHIIEREAMAMLKDLICDVDTKDVEIEPLVVKGNLIDTTNYLCKSLGIDLLLLEPRTNSISDEVYLGKTSGSIVKRTQIPALIVPEGYVYKPIASFLFATKRAGFKNSEVLTPLIDINNQFRSKVNLLLVKTPSFKEGDFQVNKTLKDLVLKTKITENPTTFQGVLEQYKSFEPDVLCVVRRQRGFFNLLWEEDTILKRDFYVSSMPVLVLAGLK